MASNRVNIATMLLLLFLALFSSTQVNAKREQVEHGSPLDISDLLLELEKRLSASNFDSYLFDNPKSSSGGSESSSSKNTKDNPTPFVYGLERRSEVCKHEVTKGNIIRATDSLNEGAEFVDSVKGTESNAECQQHCCKNTSCDVAVYQDKGDRYCYLFHCEDKCLYKKHAGYLVNIVTRITTTAGKNSVSNDNDGGQGSETDLQNLSGGGGQDGGGSSSTSGGESSRTSAMDDQAENGVSSEGGKTSNAASSQSEATSKDQEPPAPHGPPVPVISQHSVSLSGYCTHGIQCEDTNAACLNNNCKCRTGFYNKDGICRTICPPSNFECFELGTITRGPECVPKTQVCDSYMQCADGSDEFNCGAVDAASQQQGGWNGQYLDPYSQPSGTSLQEQQQQRQQLQQQQQMLQAHQQQHLIKQPSERPSDSGHGGYNQQQLAGNVQQQQLKQVGPSGAMRPSVSSSSLNMNRVKTNSAPASLANAANSGSEGNSFQSQVANSKAIPNPKPTYSNSMQANIASPYPANANSNHLVGQAAYPLSSSSQQQGIKVQGQPLTPNRGPQPSVGSPVGGLRTPQNQVSRMHPSNPLSDNTFNRGSSSNLANIDQSVVGNPVRNNYAPPMTDNMLGLEGNMVAPSNGNDQGQPQVPLQQNALQSSQPKIQRPQASHQQAAPLSSGQRQNMVSASGAQPGKSPSPVKENSLSEPDSDKASSKPVSALKNDKTPVRMASHLQQSQEHEGQLKPQHSHEKASKDNQHQDQRQQPGNDRPSSLSSSNGQQWVDPSVYLPYNFGGSNSADSRQQQQQLQPTLGAGGYFDSRYYPSGYGQMSSGYNQDNIPSSLFSNTASADDFSQFGEPYLSQEKSLSNNGYYSAGGYPDVNAYDGSPSASSSSQIMRPTNSGGYDFDGGYHSPQSYQDMDLYMSGKQGYKPGPSYKMKNTGYKPRPPNQKMYGTRAGLYEDFPSEMTHEKSNTKSKTPGSSSKTKVADAKHVGPTTLKAPTVSNQDHKEKSGKSESSEDSESKLSAAVGKSNTTHKPVSNSSPSPSHQRKVAESSKHLFVSSSREKVIIASPGGGNAEGPIIALSLGLALTLVLLVMVVCRLRGVKHRLRKGRPLSQNEADYLINGMYL